MAGASHVSVSYPIHAINRVDVGSQRFLGVFRLLGEYFKLIRFSGKIKTKGILALQGMAWTRKKDRKRKRDGK